MTSNAGPEATQTNQQDSPTDRPPWWRRKWGMALIVILALVVISSLADEPDVADQAETVNDAAEDVAEDPADAAAEGTEPSDDETTDWAEVYGNIGVQVEDFRERWNATIRDAEAGPPMGQLHFEEDPVVGLDVARLHVENWIEAELYRDDDGYVVQFFLDAEPRDEGDGAQLIAALTAGVAAALDLTFVEAFEIVEQDLGLAEADIGMHDEVHEVDGIVFELGSFNGWWDFAITRAPDSS
jgi:hypothetical protein